MENAIYTKFLTPSFVDTTATESSDPENLKRTKTVNISNFKPFNKIFEGKTLYLDGKYSRVLYSYINYCQIDIKRLESQPDIFKFTGFNDYDTINYYRNMLLNRHIPSFRGHWGDNYILVTHPVVTSISFNKDRTIAALAFTSKFEGSSEFYIKKNGKWEYSHKSKGGWIE
ncbi:MAG TPA: hypothetical protein PLK90_05710 [Clostridiales bacterium]|nr:hypothetical protein [Clostridiales bacterium]HQP69879.1 hypothetical protein [Clostridiales bacterium]